MGAALEFSSNDPASRGGRLSFMLKAVSVLASLGLKIRKYRPDHLLDLSRSKERCRARGGKNHGLL